jgi:hypothetical protein
MCVIYLLCLIVLPLPPGENPFAVKINNIIILYKYDNHMPFFADWEHEKFAYSKRTHGTLILMKKIK